jgi:hypothetical protein
MRPARSIVSPVSFICQPNRPVLTWGFSLANTCVVRHGRGLNTPAIFRSGDFLSLGTHVIKLALITCRSQVFPLWIFTHLDHRCQRSLVNWIIENETTRNPVKRKEMILLNIVMFCRNTDMVEELKVRSPFYCDFEWSNYLFWIGNRLFRESWAFIVAKRCIINTSRCRSQLLPIYSRGGRALTADRPPKRLRWFRATYSSYCFSPF